MKKLIWWRTLPLAFKELEMANQFINENDVETICQTPLTYNSRLRQFEEIYRVEKTGIIKVKT